MHLPQIAAISLVTDAPPDPGRAAPEANDGAGFQSIFSGVRAVAGHQISDAEEVTEAAEVASAVSGRVDPAPTQLPPVHAGEYRATGPGVAGLALDIAADGLAVDEAVAGRVPVEGPHTEAGDTHVDLGEVPSGAGPVERPADKVPVLPAPEGWALPAGASPVTSPTVGVQEPAPKTGMAVGRNGRTIAGASGAPVPSPADSGGQSRTSHADIVLTSPRPGVAGTATIQGSPAPAADPGAEDRPAAAGPHRSRAGMSDPEIRWPGQETGSSGSPANRAPAELPAGPHRPGGAGSVAPHAGTPGPPVSSPMRAQEAGLAQRVEFTPASAAYVSAVPGEPAHPPAEVRDPGGPSPGVRDPGRQLPEVRDAQGRSREGRDASAGNEITTPPSPPARRAGGQDEAPSAPPLQAGSRATGPGAAPLPAMPAPVSAPDPSSGQDGLFDTDKVLSDAALGEPRTSSRGPAAGTPPIFQAPETARNVALQIAEVLRASGERAVELRLQPEELGRVQMTMSQDASGTLTVALTAERAETLDLLRRNIDLLGADLHDLGYESVDFSFQGDGGAAEQDPSPGRAAAIGTPGADAETGAPGDGVSRPTALALGASDDGIDIRL